MTKQLEERAIRSLRSLGDCPTVRLALGRGAFPLGQPSARQLRANIANDPHFLGGLNVAQRNAVFNAFAFDYSLIWGPPGTGKTVTGVQIAFCFVRLNRSLKADLPSDDDSFVTASEGEDAEDDPELGMRFSGEVISQVLHLNFPKLPRDVTKPRNLGERHRQVLYCGPSNACVNCVASEFAVLL